MFFSIGFLYYICEILNQEIMPYSREAAYRHHRQKDPALFDKKTFKTVPISHTNYTGKKFAAKGNKAIVGKYKKCKDHCWHIQSILELKK